MNQICVLYFEEPPLKDPSSMTVKSAIWCLDARGMRNHQKHKPFLSVFSIPSTNGGSKSPFTVLWSAFSQ